MHHKSNLQWLIKLPETKWVDPKGRYRNRVLFLIDKGVEDLIHVGKCPPTPNFEVYRYRVGFFKL